MRNCIQQEEDDENTPHPHPKTPHSHPTPSVALLLKPGRKAAFLPLLDFKPSWGILQDTKFTVRAPLLFESLKWKCHRAWHLESQKPTQQTIHYFLWGRRWCELFVLCAVLSVQKKVHTRWIYSSGNASSHVGPFISHFSWPHTH